MHSPDEPALLALYRACRERDPGDFQEQAMRLVRSRLDHASSLWGAARYYGEESRIIPSMVHTVGLGAEFSVGWAQRNHKDPLVTSATRQMGTMLRIDVQKTYAMVPESIEAGRKYDIRSFAVIVVPGSSRGTIQWLCLYQPQAELRVSDEQSLWLSHFAPHMSGAYRVNQLLNQVQRSGAHDEGLAVVETSTGILIRADDEFLLGMSSEWRGFDASRMPSAIRCLSQDRPSFEFVGRETHLRGRRFDGLTLLRLSRRATAHRLTRRQLEVAELYVRNLSTKEVAKHLQLSHATVRNHLAATYGALEVHSKLDLARRLEEMNSV